MEPLFSSERLEMRKNILNYVKKTEAAHRKLIISDIEQIIGRRDIWRYFSFPIRIPTAWLEEWKQGLILKQGSKRDKGNYLFELLKESRKK